MSDSPAAAPAQVQDGEARESGAAPPAGIALVARQPIFDADLAVAAYELLYRTPGATRALVGDPARATAQVMVNAAVDFGLAQLVGERPAYINFPAELLKRQFQPPLHPHRVVIEVLEDCTPDEELLRCLGRLRQQGHRVALDDYDVRRQGTLLLECADIVKVDVREHTPAELAASVAALRRHPLCLVAEKIETRAELRRCRELGFDLFQGYFLEEPQVMQTRHIPCDRRAALELVVRLNNPEASVECIEQSICRDVGLSCRILRCVNSSYYRLPRTVSSIREAILLLGFGELQKLGWLMLLAGLSGQPSYLCVQSLLRAHLCEALCRQAQLPAADSYFMTGMLSMLDLLLGLPMSEALATLPLHDNLRDALLRRRGDLGAALACAEAYEHGRWEAVRFRGLAAAQITACYAQAAASADRAWRDFRGG